MRIHPPALKRLSAAPLKASDFADTFKNMLTLLETFDSPGIQVTMDYQHKDDRPEDSDLVPVIVLSFRPATMREEA